LSQNKEQSVDRKLTRGLWSVQVAVHASIFLLRSTSQGTKNKWWSASVVKIFKKELWTGKRKKKHRGGYHVPSWRFLRGFSEGWSGVLWGKTSRG
jgi:hypothetical protein